MTDLNEASRDAERLHSLLADTKDVSDLLGRTLVGTFRAASLEGRRFEDVLTAIGRRLSDRALTMALRPLESLVSSGLQGLFGAALQGFGATLPSGFAKGGLFRDGRPVPFAQGGLIDRPQLFPMADGRTGLMGEAGPEAVLPLARGADGRLGVRAGATGTGGVSVHVQITTPDVEGFRKAEAQIGGILARAVGRGRRGHRQQARQGGVRAPMTWWDDRLPS